MGTFTKILPLLLLSLATSAGAAQYFINSSPTGCSGSPCSNANNGTATTTAWADPSTVVTRALLPDDTVSLFGGGAGNTQLYRYPTPASQADMMALGANVGGTSGHPITFNTYGGGLPLLDGSDDLSGATWTVDSGNIYTTPLAVFPIGVYNSLLNPQWPLPLASCEIGPCPGTPAMTQPAMLSCWSSSHGAYAANSQVMNCVRPGEWWFTVAGGNPGGTAPTCTTSCTGGTTTFTDGTITWVYGGPAAAMQGAMTAGTWWWSANKLYVWMPNGASPAGQVIMAAMHPYGFNDQANGAEKNWITLDGLGFQHLGTPVRAFTNGTGGFLAGQVYRNLVIRMAGTGPVDDGSFWNCLQFGGSNSGGTNPAPLFQFNTLSFCGGHMGGLTVQTGTGGTIDNNDISVFSHAGVNMVSQTVSSNSNVTITNNRIHDTFQALNYNSPSTPSSNVGIYCENCPSPTIKNNAIWSIKGVCGSGQCDGVQTFAGSNALVACNTMYAVQTCYYESNGGVNQSFMGNICDISTGGGTLGTTSWAVNTGSGTISAANSNVLGGETNVAIVAGVNKNMAAWRGLGYDAQGLNQYASFASGYPFPLLPGSPGLGLNSATCGINAGMNQTSATGGRLRPHL